MKFKFIGNACGIFTGSEGTQILCDPWIVDGVFEGSWFHYPPLNTKIKDLQSVDAIYVSHVHPDHYDDRNFEFKKDIPIIILNEGPNFLKKNLEKKGFTNLIEIKDNETQKFREFNLTLNKPFVGHIYEESLLGNLVDSSLVIENDGIIAINFNDNTPNGKACIELKKKFKEIDFALLNYNAAGPYPSCFNNLSIEEKKSEHSRILKRNFDHLCSVIPLLKPKNVLPFAGSYILGGKNYYKNEYLGTTSVDVCADYLKKNLSFKTNVVCLRENQTFDILNQKSLDKYERVNLDEMKNYIEKIKDFKYEYELDKEPDNIKIEEDIHLAKEKLISRIKKFNIDIKTNIFIEINEKKIPVYEDSDNNINLYCSLDNKLLRRILDKKAHWNNSEIGAHIHFKRIPNEMNPDVHTIMSFFHL